MNQLENKTVEDSSDRAKVVILATGGTIAGVGDASTNTGSYRSAVVNIQSILESVPEIHRIANISAEQIFQIDSSNFDDPKLIELGRRISDLLKQENVDGIVVTHGTDSLEETAYFLNLTLNSTKPVVLVGSMRPGSALSADGPLNLYNAVVVAGGKEARGVGTLVVMNDEIHPARDVTKTNSNKVNTFRSLYGPLGHVVEGQTLMYRLPARAHTLASEFDIDTLAAMPAVNIVYAYVNMQRVAIDSLVATGSRAIIFAGFGNGNIPDYVRSALLEARRAGVFIVRASRTGSGVVVRNGEAADDENDYIVVDDQNPRQARLLMALALTKTSDTKEIQNIFRRY